MIEFTLNTNDTIYINKTNILLVFETEEDSVMQTYIRLRDNINYPVTDTLEEALIKLS